MMQKNGNKKNGKLWDLKKNGRRKTAKIWNLVKINKKNGKKKNGKKTTIAPNPHTPRPDGTIVEKNTNYIIITNFFVERLYFSLL